MPTVGRMAITQKISSHRSLFIQSDYGPIARSSTKLTSDHDPKAMPDIIAACSRDYLLKTQRANGSWRAESHVTFKAQPCFDNDDPHGEHQFLFTAVMAWAVAGLAQLLPPK